MTFLDCTCVPENLGQGECPVHGEELKEMTDHYNELAEQLEAQAEGLRKASGETACICMAWERSCPVHGDDPHNGFADPAHCNLCHSVAKASS